MHKYGAHACGLLEVLYLVSVRSAFHKLRKFHPDILVFSSESPNFFFVDIFVCLKDVDICLEHVDRRVARSCILSSASRNEGFLLQSKLLQCPVNPHLILKFSKVSLQHSTVIARRVPTLSHSWYEDAARLVVSRRDV